MATIDPECLDTWLDDCKVQMSLPYDMGAELGVRGVACVSQNDRNGNGDRASRPANSSPSNASGTCLCCVVQVVLLI